MSTKQVKLNDIANEIVSNVNAFAALTVKGKALAAQCSKMADSSRRVIDAELVNYYAAQAGVSVEAPKREHAYHCALVGQFDKGAAEAMALSRARGILWSNKRAAKKADARTTSDAHKMVAALLSNVKKIKSVSAEDKKEIRAAMSALAALL